MWSGEVRTYEGTYSKLAEPINSPQVVSKPHPPILIGGTGEQKTLRFVAKYGDACNLFFRMGDDALRHKLEVLKGHCEAEGRPYEEIEKTSLDSIIVARDGREGSMSPQQALDYFGQQAEMGFDHAIFSLRNVSDPDAFEVFQEIAPAVHDIRPAGR